MRPFDNVNAEVSRQDKLYSRARSGNGQFVGSVRMGSGLGSEVGLAQNVSKNLVPRIKIPKPPKPPVPGNNMMPKPPRPAAPPRTRPATPAAPKVKETGLGVRKSYQRVPTTRRERAGDRTRSAASGAATAGALSGGLTYALNARAPGRARAAAQMVGIGAGIGGALGAAQRPSQSKFVRKSERGDLVARQFSRDRHRRTSRGSKDRVLATERVSRKVSKMSPDPSAVHVTGTPRARSQDQSRAQRAARTRKLQPRLLG